MKQLIITCDTEAGELTTNVKDSFEIFIEGRVDGQEAGYRQINQIAAEYGAVVEHFVDVYGHAVCGEDRMQNLCNDILEQGHSVQLHTHPRPVFDWAKRFMHEFSLEEQNNIIAHGLTKIRSWTGTEAIAHRSGGFGSNANTQIALEQNGIFLDSSYVHAYPDCQLKSDYINSAFCQGKIGQYPVPVIENTVHYSPAPLYKKMWSKLDYRFKLPVSDILKFIQNAPDNFTIIYLMHSFNFIGFHYHTKQKRLKQVFVNPHYINSFHQLLDGIRQMEGVEFGQFKDLEKQPKALEYTYSTETKRSLFGAIRDQLDQKIWHVVKE
jgi:hypothetical protein